MLFSDIGKCIELKRVLENSRGSNIWLLIGYKGDERHIICRL
jgi:hypothetical protein